MDKADLIAINTDVQSLASSVAAHKVQLGRTVTRGLGAGGDPELGYDAAHESADEIRQALADARMIFICAGLGRWDRFGRGARGRANRARSGLARYWCLRRCHLLSKANVALPRRRRRSRDCTKPPTPSFVSRTIEWATWSRPKAGIHQAFAVADMTISQSVRSIVNLIQRPGLIRIGFDDLLAALRSRGGRCLFGYGESDSDNRAHDALTQALKNPLMDRGRMLADASQVLVQVTGGPAMTLSEVEILMQELGRHISDHTQILFGTSVDGRMGNRLSVTLISSLPADEVEVAPRKSKAHALRPRLCLQSLLSNR